MSFLTKIENSLKKIALNRIKNKSNIYAFKICGLGQSNRPEIQYWLNAAKDDLYSAVREIGLEINRIDDLI